MARPRYLPGSTHSFTVKRDRGRRTLGTYLASRLNINDRRALFLLEKGEVRFNGRRVGVGDILDVCAQSVVEVVFPQEWPPYMAPREMELRILHEDAQMCVLDKPPGIVVHPARGHLSGNTVQNGLIHHYREDTNPDKSIAPVHRLDRDTTGVLVFARTRAAYRELTRLFATPSPKKTYLAICEGVPDWRERVVELPIGESPEWQSRSAVVAVEDGGRAARTELRCLEHGADWSLIEARPITGRGHQIRLHLAEIGLPLFGDSDYNPHSMRVGISRQALHASALRITHPEDGREVEFSAPLPEDMRDLLAGLRAQA